MHQHRAYNASEFLVFLVFLYENVVSNMCMNHLYHNAVCLFHLKGFRHSNNEKWKNNPSSLSFKRVGFIHLNSWKMNTRCILRQKGNERH